MRRPFVLCRALFALLLFSLFVPPVAGPANAQMPVSVGGEEPDRLQTLVDELNPEQKETLVKLIELLEENRAGARADAPVVDPITQLKQVLTGFRSYVAEKVAGLPELLSVIGKGLSGLSTEAPVLLGFLLMSLVAGALAELIFVRAAEPWRERIKVPSDGALGDTVAKLSLRAVLELGGVVVFILVSLALAHTVPSKDSHVVSISSFVLFAIALPRAATAVLRFVLAPKRPDLRLVAADDHVVARLYWNLASVFALGGLLMFLSDFLTRAGHDAEDGMRFWTAFLATFWLSLTIWRTRSGLTKILIGEGEAPTPGLARMARWWPPAMVALLVANWLFIQTAVSAGAEVISPLRGTLVIVIILVTPFLDTMVRGIAEHLVPREPAPPRPEPGDEVGAPVPETPDMPDTPQPAVERQTRFSYIRIGRALLLAAVVVLVGKVWGLSLQGLAAAGIGAELAANLVGAVLILAGGYLVWEFSNLWINRRLIEEGVTDAPSAPGHGGEGGGAGQSRMATILPLIRMVLSAVIGIMTILLALDALGINITPLLAGAGVIGLAVGFGAQTLVKDVVSGIFFLLDDAFRVGEFIDAGGTLGAVEKISVRSILLRSVNGPIHIIPYGEIAKVTNMSRDWVIMKLRFTVPFETDLDKVRKIFKKIGQEMMEVPELAEGIIEPFKSQGAADVDDVGIIVRGKFMTKPGHQFAVRKEVYSRVQKAFKENGIDFARKEVRVNIPGKVEGAALTPEQENAIAAAASQAAEPAPVESQAKKTPADDR